MITTSPPTEQISTTTVGWTDLLTRAVVAAPDRLVTSFLAACVPVGLAGTFRIFTPAVVIPAVIVFVVAAWLVTPSRYRGVGVGRRAAVGAGSEQALSRAAAGAALVGVAVLVWIWVNHRYSAQYVVLQRDPAIYTLRGMWMTDHSSPLIDASAEANAAGGLPGVIYSALGFPAQGVTIYPQASGLVPGLLGVAGWVKGLSGLLSANLAVAGVALVAVYGFARRLLGPLWALVPFAALALCMPMIAFSRAPYSEPTALAAVFGGLTLLWIGWERGQWWTFAVAGVLTGVGSLARIDGGIAIIGMLAGFGVVTLGARSTFVRRQAAARATWFFLGAGLMNAFGLLDSKLNSPIYLSSESGNLVPLAIGTVLAWLVVVAAAFVPLGRLREIVADRRSTFATIALVGSLVIGLVLASRPLWWTARLTPESGENAVRGMQIRTGLAQDPTRSYDESSVSWLGMYLGWVTVLLAGIGAALLLMRIVRARDPRVAVFVMTVACAALLYLNRISIFPDQIWAMRRFLPIIIPGLLIAAVYPLRVAVSRRPWLTWIAGGIAAAVVAFAVIPWSGPVATTANGDGQVQEMKQSCAVVAGRPVVLTGKNPGSAWFLPTFKIGCEVPTLQYVEATPEGLAKIRANYGTDVMAVTFDPKSVTWTTGTAPPPVITSAIPVWSQPLQRVPSTIGVIDRQMWIGVVQPDGRVAPLS
jgi:hypothetical protein